MGIRTRHTRTFRFLLGATAALGLGFTACSNSSPARFCQGDGLCIEPDGQLVTPDGTPICEINNTCSTGGDSTQGDNDPPSGDQDPGDSNGGGDTPPPPPSGCSCEVTALDNDGDCLPNDVEDANGNSSVDAWVDANTNNCFDEGDTAGESNPNEWDTDGDGIGDGCEDRNHNGQPDPFIFESLTFSTDSDCDGIPDGVEDGNQNGLFEPSLGETSAARKDSDGDGVEDGSEDPNGNGIVDAWTDTDGDGCFDDGEPPGETDPSTADTDDDGLLDTLEDKNANGLCDPGETCAFHPDTDCDGIPDGVEDSNQDGIVGSSESDPLSRDSDGDGLEDAVEDTNLNGIWDVGLETNPRALDTDGDNIPDGVEDLNANGQVDAFVDEDADGCWDEGEAAGETDPRKADSDGDGIRDNLEDRDQDGTCLVADLPNPLDPSGPDVRTFVESCAFLADTDCDGLSDGLEDTNRNGSFEIGELGNPRLPDTDRDGLTDGCPTGADPLSCEDQNNNGIFELGETDPRRADSDGDELSDGCELNFDPSDCQGPICRLDPNSEDTDGDGIADGEEDINHNCRFDPAEGESDPRIVDPPPDPGTLEETEILVCGTQNLKQITFAASSRTTHDYRLAFEVEKQASGDDCPGNDDAECPAGLRCDNLQCVAENFYITRAFGKDNNGDGFDADNPIDDLFGHVFQSPPGVVLDPATQEPINRDIYGFVLASENTEQLDTILDGIRDALGANADIDIEQVGDLTARPAHDDLSNFRILFAQRIFRLQLSSNSSALALRNRLLSDEFLNGDTIDPSDVPPAIDPVYGSINCATSERCFDNFSLYMSAVKRLDQTGPDGDPVVLLIVALTQDDSDQANAALAFSERQARLEDLTGGSHLARFAAERGKVCDEKAPTKSLADIMWVVDDSRSMQQIISKLQQAARDAQAVLTANAGIVDFRVAMTTTNPSVAARAQCFDSCDETCGGPDCNFCNDPAIGCIKLCPQGCDQTCAAACGPTAESLCTPTCFTDLQAAVDAEVNTNNYALPGGGGQFYFEDTEFLDCDSVSSGGAVVLDPCDGTAFQSQFSSFYDGPDGGGGLNRKQLLAHGGFVASGDPDSCTTALMNISEDPTTSGACTDENDSNCCARLTADCADGPTVLASQMCNLVREMGGRSAPGSLGSARFHSSPEHGSRSARRLIDSMLPALPQGYTGPLDASKRLRLRCTEGDPGCPAECDPRIETDCDLVPLVSLFLSDEEDFWFKDDCQPVDPNQLEADKLELPEKCYYKDGDPATAEDCDMTYCTSSAFSTGIPQGYLPDSTATNTSDTNSLQWRDAAAPECSPLAADVATSCVGDPCRQLTQDQCDCDPNDVGCTPGNDVQHNFCWWLGGQCINQCSSYTRNAPISEQERQQQRSDCESDGFCRWEQAYVTTSSQRNACVMKVPINDCQACKRYVRSTEAITGGDEIFGPDFIGLNLAGQGEASGRVYAIVRDKGVQGFGGPAGSPEDQCGGGVITWGRGDGQAYRDMAIGTLGRTQNVCADNYRDFMQLLIGDLAVLSAPYELTGTPIAATIKVGIARPLPDVQCDQFSPPATPPCFEFIEVPRSRVQGFFYDATTNSVAFKSDPIDGVCDDGSCAIDGIFDQAEVLAAREAPHVPLDGDQVFISYRFWKPVPCQELCADEETCVRVVCVEESQDPVPCPGGDDSLCPLGHVCIADNCVLDCTPGELIDQCIPNQECGICEAFDLDTGTCQQIGDTCDCNPAGGQFCDPALPNSCPSGLFCGEGCACESVPLCTDAVANDGTPADCQAALDCCAQQADPTLQATCAGIVDQGTCDGTAGCAFANGSCFAPTCCAGNESVSCFVDPESGDAFLRCEPAACECAPSCQPNETCEQLPGGGCQCFFVPG